MSDTDTVLLRLQNIHAIMNTAWVRPALFREQSVKAFGRTKLAGALRKAAAELLDAGCRRRDQESSVTAEVQKAIVTFCGVVEQLVGEMNDARTSDLEANRTFNRVYYCSGLLFHAVHKIIDPGFKPSPKWSAVEEPEALTVLCEGNPVNSDDLAEVVALLGAKDNGQGTGNR